MSPDSNKMTIIRYGEAVWNSGNLDSIEDYIAPDYVRHDPGLPMQVRGPEGIRQLVSFYRNAFPDLHFELEFVMAEGDNIAARWTVRGTHQAELMGIPATGKTVSLTAIEIYRLAGEKIAEQWVAVDNLGLLQQLGAIPSPA